MDKKLYILMQKTYNKYATEYYQTEDEIVNNIKNEILFSKLGTKEEREKAYQITLGKINGLLNFRKKIYTEKVNEALSKNNPLNNIPYDKALNYIKKQLINSKEISTPTQKFLLAYAIKIIICNHLKINPNQIGIFFINKKEDEFEASWQNWSNYIQTKNRNEMFGRIVIRPALLSTTNIYSIISIFHEFGHINQDFTINNGRPLKSSENYVEYDFGNSKVGQFMNSHFWITNNLEIDADLFATNMVKQLIRHFESTGTPKEDLVSATKFVKEMESYNKRTQSFHKLLHKPICFLTDHNIL